MAKTSRGCHDPGQARENSCSKGGGTKPLGARDTTQALLQWRLSCREKDTARQAQTQQRPVTREVHNGQQESTRRHSKYDKETVSYTHLTLPTILLV
eukprot:4449658-Amphidinium_carterae.2